MDLTDDAVAGWYEMPDRPAYDSSPSGLAYLAGLAHRRYGLPRPHKASMSRGYTVRIDGILYDTTLESFREITATH